MKQLLFLLMFALCGSWASTTQPVGYTEIEQWFENNPTKARALFTGQISEEECPPFFDVEKLALYAQEYVYLQYINKKRTKLGQNPNCTPEQYGTFSMVICILCLIWLVWFR